MTVLLSLYVCINLKMEPQEKDRIGKFELNKTDISKLGFDLSS